MPWMLAVPYIAVVGSFVLGYLVIRRGLILEPPAFLSRWIALATERLAARFATQ
jgi:hypothetical protein